MRFSFSPALLLVAACGAKPDAAQDFDALDRELTSANSAANLRDPAIAEALNAPIAIDPTLAQSSNANAVRPPPRPDSGQAPPDGPLPDPVNAATLKPAPAPKADCRQCKTRPGALTLGELARRDARACAPVSYAAGWANRLPADLPLYPAARVIEAAGSDGACSLRVVSFATGAAPAKVIDWYNTRVTAAGYSAEHRADGKLNVLGGTRGVAAYVVYVSPRAGGSTVDLVSAGR